MPFSWTVRLVLLLFLEFFFSSTVCSLIDFRSGLFYAFPASRALLLWDILCLSMLCMIPAHRAPGLFIVHCCMGSNVNLDFSMLSCTTVWPRWLLLCHNWNEGPYMQIVLCDMLAMHLTLFLLLKRNSSHPPLSFYLTQLSLYFFVEISAIFFVCTTTVILSNTVNCFNKCLRCSLYP